VTLLDAALGYARARIPVFPVHGITSAGRCTCGKASCEHPGKHPACEHGLKDATTDEATIRAWWSRRPDANIGIVTGPTSGIAVLDIDPRNGGSEEGLILDDYELPATPTQDTGGGGAHFVFAHPDGKVKSVSSILRGVDVKAGGGYVVAPPSMHASGRRYAWRAGLELGTAPLAEMPEWLKKLTMPSVNGNGHHPRNLTSPRPAPARGYAEKALAAELAAVRSAVVGTRNETLNRSSFNLGQLVGADLLSESTVRSELLAAALDAGLTEAEAAGTIASGLGDGMANPRQVPERPARARVAAPALPPADDLSDFGMPPAEDVDLAEWGGPAVRTDAPVEGADTEPPLPEVLTPGAHHTDCDQYLEIGNDDFAREIIAAIPEGQLYIRGGQLGEVVGEPGAQTFQASSENRTRVIVDRHVRLTAWKTARGKNAHPEKFYQNASRDHAGIVLAGAGLDGIGPAELKGIISAPTMRPDGSILERPGYDVATGLLYDPAVDFPPVPDRPTFESAKAALCELVEPFLEFCFVKQDVGLAVCAAAVLSLVARNAIDGCVPMFPARSTTPGSGKDLLAVALCRIGTGREPRRTSDYKGKNADMEWKKVLLAYAMEGHPAILIGNVEGSLGSASLADALTKRTISERLLGFTRTVEAPLNMVWFASGNGLTFRGDLGRRVVPLDLEPAVEHPEDRTGPQPGRTWAHPDLIAYVTADRPRLVVSALTVLRAFHLAGRPAHGKPLKGSFEAWDRLIRAAVIWAGGVDPLDACEEVKADGDADLDALRGALARWNEAFPEPKTAAGAVDYAKRSDAELHNALAALVKCDTTKLDGKALGYALKHYKGRVANGMKFVKAERDLQSNVLQWKVEVCG
jgi:hypothetical protein